MQKIVIPRPRDLQIKPFSSAINTTRDRISLHSVYPKIRKISVGVNWSSISDNKLRHALISLRGSKLLYDFMFFRTSILFTPILNIWSCLEFHMIEYRIHTKSNCLCWMVSRQIIFAAFRLVYNITCDKCFKPSVYCRSRQIALWQNQLNTDCPTASFRLQFCKHEQKEYHVHCFTPLNLVFVKCTLP